MLPIAIVAIVVLLSLADVNITKSVVQTGVDQISGQPKPPGEILSDVTEVLKTPISLPIGILIGGLILLKVFS